MVVTFSLMLFGALAVSWPLNIRYVANEKRVLFKFQVPSTQYPVSRYPGNLCGTTKYRYPGTQHPGAQYPGVSRVQVTSGALQS